MILPLLLFTGLNPQIFCGKVVDAGDKLPIYSAMVYTPQDTVYTNVDGTFQIPVSNGGFSVKSLGFQTTDVNLPINGKTIEIESLNPELVTIVKRKKN